MWWDGERAKEVILQQRRSNLVVSRESGVNFFTADEVNTWQAAVSAV